MNKSNILNAMNVVIMKNSKKKDGHSYNCSFTDENYDTIFPIINKYSCFLDDIFVYNCEDDDSI